jgi:hypothetical protein
MPKIKHLFATEKLEKKSTKQVSVEAGSQILMYYTVQYNWIINII